MKKQKNIQKVLIITIISVLIALGCIAAIRFLPIPFLKNMLQSTKPVEPAKYHPQEETTETPEEMPVQDDDHSIQPTNAEEVGNNMIIKITQKSQIEALLSSKKPAVVKFYADFCGACQMSKIPYATIAKKLEGKVTFYEVDAANQDIMNDALQITDETIQGIPAFICFLDGKAQEMIAGFGNEEVLEARIRSALKL